MDILAKNYNVFMEKVIQIHRTKSKASCITAAILLVLAKQLYSFFRVPKNLRHIPSVSYFAMAKSFYSREAPSKRFKRITSQAINEGHGFYVSKVPVNWTVYITNPVAAKQFLLKTENFPKSHMRIEALGNQSISAQFLGRDHVAITNGDTWKKQRRIMNPAFHRLMPVKKMASVIPTLFSVIEQENGRVSIAKKLQDYTLDILGLTIFDFDFRTLHGDPENWASIYKVVTDSLFDPVSSILTSFERILIYIHPKRRRSADAVVKLNEKFSELIQKRREDIEKGIFTNKANNEKDLLTLMLEGEKKGEVLQTDEELRHNIAVFFLAGHETTANAMSFCLYELAKHKDVQQKLREEIIRVIGDEPNDIEPTIEELRQMEYMNLVIKENLRLNGPADLLFPRKATESMSLAGTFIPKGTIVSIDMCAIHHDSKNWKDPDQFLPERFAEGGEQEGHEGLTWIPFSGGSRQCLGMNFSLTEQRLTLAMILKKYEVDIPKDSIHYDHIVFERPATAAPLSLELTFTKRY